MSTDQASSFRYPMLVTLLLIPVLGSFSGALINPTIPAIQETFSHLPNSNTLAQMVSTMSAPIVVVVAPIVGYLLDRYKRKPVLVAAVVIYGVGTSSAFFLDSIYLILLTRVLDGIAVATIMVTVPTLISDYYSGSRRESVMGWYGGVSLGSGAVAALLGGYIASFNWRYIFLVYAGALLLIPPIIRYLPEPDVKQVESDEIGRIEAAINIVKESPVAILLVAYLLVTFGMLTNNLIQIEVPYYLQESLGVSSSMTGVALSIAMASGGVAGMLYGRVKQRFSHPTILMGTFAIAAVGYFIISATDAFAIVSLGICIAAGGIGFLLPTVNDWVAAIVKPEYRGRALSGVTVMMYLGFAISPFVPQPLVSEFGRQTTLLIWSGFLVVVTVGLGALWLLDWGTSPTTDAVQPE